MGAPCHFALFDLQPAFRIDQQLLSARYRELAKIMHPDRFADASQQDQRLALEHSAGLNEAYQVLKSAPRRAHYLLGLQGHELPMEATVQDPQFLLQQMELREELDAIERSPDAQNALAAFATRLNKTFKQRSAQMVQELDDQQWSQAADTVRKLRFLDKLQQQIEQLEEKLLGFE